MSPKAQWMTIATALGWKNLKWIESYDEISGESQFFELWADNPEWARGKARRVMVPDYLGDLNRSWEFEKVIEDNALDHDYLCELHGVIWNERCWKVSEANHFSCATATAAQRAEAFLRVMDIWVDSPKGK